MGLELRRDANHNLRSKWWYGRYTANGKRNFINLGIEVRGTPPDDLRYEGNVAFECSRTLASAKLNELIHAVNSQKSAEKHLEELYELKAGSPIQQLPLCEIEHRWLNLPQRKERSKLWETNQCATLLKFREFVEKKYPNAKTLAQISV